MFAIALFVSALLSPAHAAEVTGDVTVGGGLVTGQPGAVLSSGLGVRAGGLVALGEVGVGGRAAVMATAVDAGQGPILGLASVGLAYDFAVSDGVRVGPLVAVDSAVLPADERDCEQGWGCRHGTWVDAGPVGWSLAPAAGLRATFSRVGEGALTASLASQPVQLYDMVIPFQPRVAVDYTRGAWTLGSWANRYGAGLGVGAVIGGR